jgi:hypothetical protein
MTARSPRVLITLTVLAALIAGSGAPRAAQSNPPRAAQEEKAVYEAVIEEVLHNAGPGHSAHVAIRGTTATGQRSHEPTSDATAELKQVLESINGDSAPLDASLRAHYIAANHTAQPFPAEPALALSVPHVIQPFDLSPRDFWTQFYRKYPGSAGIVVLSRVGFNDGFTRAFVYREHLSGNLAMNGVYLVLVREAKGWRIEKTIPSWIA